MRACSSLLRLEEHALRYTRPIAEQVALVVAAFVLACSVYARATAFGKKALSREMASGEGAKAMRCTSAGWGFFGWFIEDEV